MVPSAVAALAAAAAGTSQRPAMGVWAGLVALVVVAWALRRGWWPVVVAAAVVVAVGPAAALRSHVVHDTGVGRMARDGASAVVVATGRSEPRVSTKGPMGSTTIVQMRASLVEARGTRVAQSVRVTVIASGANGQALQHVVVGQQVRLRGVLAVPRPGQPDAAVLRLRASPDVVSGPGVLDRTVNRFRECLATAVDDRPAGQRALVPSLVVGDTTRVDDAMAEDFRATALTHLMAVSGANLASTTALLWWLGSWCGLRRRALRATSVVGVVGFVIVCRAEASVVRAAAMGVVALAATGVSFDRRGGVRTLAVAVVALMVLDPWLVRSVGFWLSVCATAGILWWASPWSAAMSWAPKWLAVAVAVPWAAQLATQPVVTWLSGSVSTTGLLANLAAAPFVPVASVLGMAAAGAGCVWMPVGRLFGVLAGWCVQPIIWIAHLGARAPAGAVSWPAGALPLVVLTALCLAIALVTPLVLSRWTTAALAAAVIVAGTVVRPPVPGWPGDWQVAVCDVGQGSAALVRAGPHAAVLVDAGPEVGPLSKCLSELGVRQVPLVVLSHYHADHVAGLDAVGGHGPTSAFVVSQLASPAMAAERVRRTAVRMGAEMVTAHPGQVVTAGTAKLELYGGTQLGDVGPGEGESPAENNSSVIVRATVGGLRVLITGDAEPLEQRHVMASHPDLTSDVLVMPHHGSSRQDEEFWEATRAGVAVASAGRNNSYGHPSRKALALAERLGMEVHRTDAEGTILLARNGGSVAVRTRA